MIQAVHFMMSNSVHGQSQPRRESPGTFASKNPSFIGRTREIAALTERLGRAARGDGGVSLINGEPGIGKSRILVELAANARAGGWLVLAGRAYETEGMPPYLAFVEPIAQYIRSAPDDQAVQALAQAAREIALLVPELQDRVSPDAPAEYGPAADRYRLFEAVTNYLLGLSAGTEAAGLLLCLDDLHWADKSTLLLLRHLARRLDGSRLLVVGTYRPEEIDDSHPLAGVLAELARDGNAQRLALGRLTRAESAALVASFDYLPGPELSESIYRQTDGNPFFVQELVQHLKSQTSAAAPAGDLPETIRQVIGQRLAHLDASARSQLENAAVLGDGFEVGVLRAMAGSEARGVTAALEVAEQAGMLREQTNSYVFAHPLMRQVIYEAISLPRRQELHLNAAKAIEVIHAAGLDAHLAALATHYRLSAAEPARTIDYATRAGDRALLLFAFDEALRLYDMAIEAVRLHGASTGSNVVELHVGRGNALSALGKWPEAKDAFEAAIAGLAGEERANILLLLSNTSIRGGHDIEGAHRFAATALEIALELGRHDLEMAANGLIAQCEIVQGHLKSGLARYERAYKAREAITPVLRHRVFGNFALGLYWSGQTARAVKLSIETVESAVATRDFVASVIMQTNLGLTLAASGHYDEAIRAFAAARENASSYAGAGISHELARAIGMSASVPMAIFDYDRAEVVAAEAIELGRSVNFILPVLSETIDLMTIATHRGDLALAEALGNEVEANLALGGAHELQWGMRLATARAELALVRDEWSAALVLGKEALERARAMGRPKYEALALAARGSALAALGRKKEALGEFRQAVETARTLGDPSVFIRVAAAQLGVTAEQALATEARLVVETMLANLSDEGMRRSLETSRPVQVIHGLTGIAGAGAALQKRVYPDGLSEREVEVLHLIATGGSSREIGEQLVLSVRTVERHIANIYLKTDTHGRAQVTAYALARGLA